MLSPRVDTMNKKDEIRKWLETYSHEQLIGLLINEYSLKELWEERQGDLKSGEYKDE